MRGLLIKGNRRWSCGLIGDAVKLLRIRDDPASSGVTTLPYEILSYIFVIYTFEDKRVNPSFPFLIPDKSHGPLHICSISRQWRQIALTTPILWSSICVSHRPDLRLVKLWLERSQSLPLTLSLEPNGGDKTPEGLRFTEAAFSLFSTQLHRWRLIRITFQDPTAQAFGKLRFSNAMLLEQVHLYTHGFDNVKVIFAALLPCPSLRRLRWSGDLNIPLEAESPFFSQLTSIDLRGCVMSISEYVTLLQHCPNAAKLSLWVMTNSPLETDYPHTDLPNLQELILGQTSCDFSSIFDFFTMPALRYLFVRQISSANCYKNFRSLFERSRCRLERFTLRDNFLKQLDVIAFFQDSIVCSIPRVSFQVTRRLGHDFSLSAINKSTLSQFPVFGKDDDTTLMGWGEPWYMNDVLDSKVLK